MMTGTKPLHDWPCAAKLVLTLFLLLIGAGYLMALVNMYHQHGMADGREGMTLDDLRAVFHGLDVPVDESADVASSAPESRMYEMVKTGGKMRKNLNKGGADAVASLESWLRAGAPEDQFTQAPADGPSPASVIEYQCLDCHNADTGEKAESPFGPDMFTIDYAMVAKFSAPGTAELQVPVLADDPSQPRRIGPNAVSHLALITHIHMLSIPVFTLIVSALFVIAVGCSGIRGVVAVVPMGCLVLDFSSWWLARSIEAFLYVIPAAGALYGLGLAAQILTITVALWRRPPA